MKPQLGDTISNRYVLVSPLREETGLQVWKASDHVLARDCQLFIVNNRKALQDVNATASMLAISHDAHFTQVLQLQHVGEVALVITQLDAGMSLSEDLTQSSKPLSFTAIRSILGEVVEALHVLQKDNLTHFSISTDTVRLTRNGIEIADAPVSIMLADTSRVQSVGNQEQLAIRQVASLLYSLLTRTPSTLSTNYHLDAISPNVPMEFRVICKRGLDLKEKDGFPTVPMATIAELEALLGDYEPLAKLNGPDIALPSADSECSIVNVPLLQILEQDAIALPDTLAETGSIPEMTFEAPEPHTDFIFAVMSEEHGMVGFLRQQGSLGQGYGRDRRCREIAVEQQPRTTQRRGPRRILRRCGFAVLLPHPCFHAVAAGRLSYGRFAIGEDRSHSGDRT